MDYIHTVSIYRVPTMYQAVLSPEISGENQKHMIPAFMESTFLVGKIVKK